MAMDHKIKTLKSRKQGVESAQGMYYCRKRVGEK